MGSYLFHFLDGKKMSKQYRVRIREEKIVDFFYEAENMADALGMHNTGAEMLCEPDEGDPTETELISVKEVDENGTPKG